MSETGDGGQQQHAGETSHMTNRRIWLHLTKTAGGTLKTALMSNNNIKTAFVYGKEDLEKLKSSGTEGIDLIYGHCIFGVHNELGMPPHYICFLRHPVTRTISHYYHLRNVDKGNVGDKIRKSADINDFFKSMQHWEFSNFMTKVISGLGTSPPPEGASALQLAIKNIDEHFQFIGFQEYFALSIRKLATALNYDIVTKKDVNVGHYNMNEVSHETLAKIERLNVADVKLYKYALKKFL